MTVSTCPPPPNTLKLAGTRTSFHCISTGKKIVELHKSIVPKRRSLSYCLRLVLVDMVKSKYQDSTVRVDLKFSIKG